MTFTWQYTISFADTDAAGVVYFANGLRICHCAYEASLAATGIDITDFFCQAAIVHPIVRAEIDFSQPLHCGDLVTVSLYPTRSSETTFEIQYILQKNAIVVAKAKTKHVAVDSLTRQKVTPIPAILAWLSIYS
jgi:1,4-dihydroxy-2-naphthoyl-CoA hydrolase